MIYIDSLYKVYYNLMYQQEATEPCKIPVMVFLQGFSLFIPGLPDGLSKLHRTKASISTPQGLALRAGRAPFFCSRIHTVVLLYIEKGLGIYD